ncbi:MAG: hypothetical protein AAGA08_00420 [Pseudomonadota bacterium]
MTFSKFLAATGLAVSLAGPVAADRGLTPLQADVARELPNYGFTDVDVRSLTPVQLGHIKHLIYSDQSVAKIRGNIGAVLGDSLIRTLFK